MLRTAPQELSLHSLLEGIRARTLRCPGGWRSESRLLPGTSRRDFMMQRMTRGAGMGVAWMMTGLRLLLENILPAPEAGHGHGV